MLYNNLRSSFPLQNLPSQHPPWLCRVPSSARQNCSLSIGSVWSWIRVWSHHAHALWTAGTVTWAAALLSLPCEFSLLLWLGKGFHLPGICVCSFSHEQPEEKMRSRACSGVRNKSYLKAEEMIQMGTFVLVMVFIKNHLPASLLNPTLILKKTPSKTQIFDLIDLLLIELTGDL